MWEEVGLKQEEGLGVFYNVGEIEKECIMEKWVQMDSVYIIVEHIMQKSFLIINPNLFKRKSEK